MQIEGRIYFEVCVRYNRLSSVKIKDIVVKSYQGFISTLKNHLLCWWAYSFGFGSFCFSLLKIGSIVVLSSSLLIFANEQFLMTICSVN